MSVADLAREAPRRYLDAMPIADWAGALLDRLGTAPTLREREHVSELVAIWRRVLEPALLAHFTLADHAALARFYATPEGASDMRKDGGFPGRHHAGPRG